MKAKLALLLASVLVPILAVAQGPPRMPAPAPMPMPPPDPVGDNLFPPELVMAHQNEIGLRPEQKTYIRQEIAKAQSVFTERQWELQDAMEALGDLLGEPQVSEEQVLAQLEKVLQAEREIKRTQMTLMVRIKNKLTPEQQGRLKELRPRPPMPPPPGPAFGPGAPRFHPAPPPAEPPPVL